MSFYEKYILPRAIELCMDKRLFARERARVLEPVGGEVLEIGFGTGLNLPLYPDRVRRLTLVDPAEMLPRRVQVRIDAAGFPVERCRLGAERLPFESERFDFVVSTWTMCSIPDLQSALLEVRRVLKPEGRLVFLEHGRSDDPRVAIWQNRLNPVWRAVAGGCNLNRPIDQLILAAGLEITDLDRYVLPGKRTHTEMYRGTARR